MTMRRTYTGVLLYLCGFALLLLVALNNFLVPVLHAAAHNGHAAHQKLAAISWLLLWIILTYLISGLMLVFRVGRFFFPRPRPPRHRTQYIDAWAESAKRIDVPKE
jgi:hypothetical protein